MKPWMKFVVIRLQMSIFDRAEVFRSRVHQNANNDVYAMGLRGLKGLKVLENQFLQWTVWASYSFRFIRINFSSNAHLTIWVPQHSTNDAVSKLHILMNLISSRVIREIDFGGVEPESLITLIWWVTLIGCWWFRLHALLAWMLLITSCSMLRNDR